MNFFKGLVAGCAFGLSGMMASAVSAAPNPNFHIYIAYGQSNMAGSGPIEAGDQDPVDNFVMLSGIDCDKRKGNPNINLAKGQWSKAVPPMFHCQEGLSVADYFGKTMAKEMPGVTVGIIPVAVGGASIKLFDKDQWQSHVDSAASWLSNWAKDYHPQGNDYAAIIDLAKKAQEVGVIKGFIFHQGETDGGMSDWEQIVKKTYDDMRKDLGIKEELPFVAGEMVYNGACHGMSQRVNGLSKYFAKFGVAKSEGTGMQSDRLHFDHDGYVEMGKRYAAEMLKLIDRTIDMDAPLVNVPLYGGGSAGNTKPEEYGPYGDVMKIPGKIEAENYNKGGSGVAYSDMDSENRGNEYRGDGVDIYKAGMGMAVGYAQKGEWLKYSIHVEEDGEYEMIGRLASDNGTGAIAVYLGDEKLGETMVSKKGPDYDTYEDIGGGKVTLKAGDYDFKIQIEVNWVNIDYVEFKKVAVVVDPGNSESSSSSEMSSSSFQNENSSSSEESSSSIEMSDSSSSAESSSSTETSSSSSAESSSSAVISVEESSSSYEEISIVQNIHWNARVMANYDVFDMQGVRIARVSAYSAQEAIANVRNSGLVKTNGSYFIRSDVTGKTLAFRAVK